MLLYPLVIILLLIQCIVKIIKCVTLHLSCSFCSARFVAINVVNSPYLTDFVLLFVYTSFPR